MPPDPWGAFAPAIHTTCEPAVAGWIVHPAQAVSAIAYLVAAVRCWRLAPAIALRVALVGLIAVGFHVSGTAVMQRVDLAVVALLNGHLLTWALIRNGYGRPAQALPMEVALAIFPAGAAFLFSWFGYFIATAVRSLRSYSGNAWPGCNPAFGMTFGGSPGSCCPEESCSASDTSALAASAAPPPTSFSRTSSGTCYRLQLARLSAGWTGRSGHPPSSRRRRNEADGAPQQTDREPRQSRRPRGE